MGAWSLQIVAGRDPLAARAMLWIRSCSGSDVSVGQYGLRS